MKGLNHAKGFAEPSGNLCRQAVAPVAPAVPPSSVEGGTGKGRSKGRGRGRGDSVSKISKAKKTLVTTHIYTHQLVFVGCFKAKQIFDGL